MMKKPHVISFKLLLTFAIAFLGFHSFLFIASPAQAGVYFHFGYGHHGDHYGYGHPYGYGYSYPYYGLHSYYGYGHHGYGHHSYGYPGYDYGYSHDGIHHDNSYAPPYTSDDDYLSGPSRTYARDSSNIATGNGWTLLGNNQTSAALSDFGRQAQASPSKGAPKVGYALASADLGHLSKGIWAMRRALRIDPHALHYITLDQNLDSKVEQIIHQYEKQQTYSDSNADAAFMLASLHYLRRNIEAARSNIDHAMVTGSIRSSTKNLKNLIDQEERG